MVIDEKNNISLLKAMGETTRYKILSALISGEKCACEIPGLINRSQPNTSMHLSKLQDLGIIKSRRDGKRILYSIKDPRVKKILEIINK
ncbi:MAG: DNA-binding transcriptional repressor ArsR [Candidatus Methanofastidiosum methylothiophilum]|uniref:DNA-binding transcriptional repressor ArsR n=1 Tax=Candidatus Methanofastidiosum methylothiophilum TaxID=1705564 RepID=A0A150IUN9_9EURY|nr:MAG: DNA-binding transcriptional repressor ArsR [Candidatus Methanofastidiosum methylthiophilus]KYC48374.1 MAG: DNA-binding transcriptional repressor ArsR [Candidatus Methanofastidiosum methylthiophilus]KYC50761.1 MAG: DNA-binding transcriptional repressor ArsR [Candidatus Methanofastidiosum methylthiophilus]